VTSAASFGDVRPTDWAYQALANLVDRSGCVAGYPNGAAHAIAYDGDNSDASLGGIGTAGAQGAGTLQLG
jgi:hypothetical protein